MTDRRPFLPAEPIEIAIDPKLIDLEFYPMSFSIEVEEDQQERPVTALNSERPTPQMGAKARPRTAPPPSASRGAFPGTVALNVPAIGASSKWQRVLRAEENPSSAEACKGELRVGCASRRWDAWDALVSRLNRLSGQERLQAVNHEINRLVKYSTDREIYGQGDYWASYAESLELGWGDCEDIAIAKMWALKAAGVPSEVMQLVILENARSGSDHAILLVEERGRSYVLDNLADVVEDAANFSHYRPIYALSDTKTWVFGVTPESSQRAALSRQAASPS